MARNGTIEGQEMNQELGEFFVKFTTQGLAEVKDAIDGLSKKMDEVGTASEKATDKQSNFFNKSTLWIGRITGLTTAVVALKKAWDAVGNAAASTMSIYQQAMLAGTSPQTIERWQWVARHQGLDPNSIVGDFRSGKELLQRFADLEIGEEFNKVFGRAGLGTDAIMASLQAGNLDATLEMLNQALSARDANGNALINSARAKDILSQLGFSDTMQILLREQNLPTLLQNAKLIYTENPETLAASIRYTDAKATLKDSWNAIWANPQLLDSATELLKYLDKVVLPALTDFFTWLLGKLGDILGTAGETQEEKNLGNTLKLAGAGVGYVIGGPIGAAAGAWVTDKAHDKLLNYEWYKNLANRVAPEGYWEDYSSQYQIMLDAVDSGNVSPMISMPQSSSNATAVVNLNDVEIVRKTGSGSTTVDMSLSQVPLSVKGG